MQTYITENEFSAVPSTTNALNSKLYRVLLFETLQCAGLTRYYADSSTLSASAGKPLVLKQSAMHPLMLITVSAQKSCDQDLSIKADH